jgi:hypothetical protein
LEKNSVRSFIESGFSSSALYFARIAYNPSMDKWPNGNPMSNLGVG